MKIWVVLLFLFFSICNTEQGQAKSIIDTEMSFFSLNFISVFQRVITIVLENTDYSVAVADPNLAALAQQGTKKFNSYNIIIITM
jgi:hypothetical protein